MRKVNKPWGYEVVWAEHPKYLGKVLHIMAAKRLSLQYHKIKEETIIIRKGTMLLEVGSSKTDLKKLTLSEGDSYHIPAGLIHRMTAVTDVEVFEVSTSEIADIVRLEDDFGRVNS